MNLCFLKGEVVEEVEFKFFYRKQQISIAKTKILLENGSVILVKGYDEVADWMYHYIEKSDFLIIEGVLDSNMEIEIKGIKLLKDVS